MSEKAKKLLVEYLIAFYQFPKKLAERYADMLIVRWTLMCMEEKIDGQVIGEDLYQETDDWESDSYMPEMVKNRVRMKLDFPNLEFSESENKANIKKEFENIKSFKEKK